MKLPAKSIPSPARTDYFPPPLMGFFSSNVASKSSARSRSSPMFARKKTSAIETEEPSSPKVTCMGRVRIRNHSKRHEILPERRRRWIRTAFFCRHFSGRIKWKGWTSFFNSETEEGSAKKETEVGGKTGKSEQDEEKDDRKKGFEPFFCSMPRNALLVTRSRSSPYPFSSLAVRFNGSALRAENTEEEQKTELDSTEISAEGPISERMRNSERNEKAKTGEEEKEEEEGSSLGPLILTRSKSEPSSVAEKLNPESNFWKLGKF